MKRRAKTRESVPFSLTCEAAVEFQAAADDGIRKPPRITISSYSGGAMYVDAFAPWPVVIDLTGLTLFSARTPILLDHDRKHIVGQADTTEITSRTVKHYGIVTGNIDDPEDPAGKVVMHARNGFQWSASVGIRPERLEYVAEGQTVKVNGLTFDGPTYVVRAGQLGEVSLLSFGADGSAAAKVAAGAALENVMNFEDWLKAKGFEDCSAEQLATLRAAHEAEQEPPAALSANPPPPAPDAVTEMRARAAGEMARIARVRELCGNDHADIAAKAISDGWAPERTELEISRVELKRLRDERPSLSIHSGGSGVAAAAPAVIEAAACITAGVRGIEQQYAPEVVEAAHHQWPSGISLQELLLRAAAANGFDRHVYRVTRGNVRAVLQAAFSTASLPTALSNVANRVALAAFSAVEATWRRVSRQSRVNDFKTITHHRLTSSAEYEQLAPTGEIKHGALGEETYTNKADTYAKILAMTRENIINDDNNVLNDVPSQLGRGGAMKLNKMFWTEFLDNSSFFTTGNNNYLAGATTALSYASVSAAAAKLLKMTDGTNEPLGIMPRILLVPATLYFDALRIIGSPVLLQSGTTDAAAAFGATNVLAGRFAAEQSVYLENSGISGYSSAAWYLLDDPADLPVIEVVFLDGRQEPVIESADADFNQLGVQWRGYHDFGVKKQDYRAGVKFKGTA